MKKALAFLVMAGMVAGCSGGGGGRLRLPRNVKNLALHAVSGLEPLIARVACPAP